LALLAAGVALLVAGLTLVAAGLALLAAGLALLAAGLALLVAGLALVAAGLALFAALLRVDMPALLAPPLFAPRDAAEPVLLEPPLKREADACAVAPPGRVLLVPPLARVEVERVVVFLPRAVVAPTAAPVVAVATGAVRRDVLRCSLSPRPALKPTVVRSGILISVLVRGLRPLRAARVRRVNFPNPGMDSDPAACTASEMAPDAVSKIASTTRAAAALVSSAFSATALMNSDLFMERGLATSRTALGAREVRAALPITPRTEGTTS
jgi:hypothetical protein